MLRGNNFDSGWPFSQGTDWNICLGMLAKSCSDENNQYDSGLVYKSSGGSEVVPSVETGTSGPSLGPGIFLLLKTTHVLYMPGADILSRQWLRTGEWRL